MLLAYVVIPMATLALLRARPLACLGIGRLRAVAPLLGVALPVVLACSWLAGGLEQFRVAYAAAPASPRLLVRAFVLLLCTEYFFRGFLVLALFPRLGWYAPLVAALPYSLLHVGKPLPELFASAPFALALSYLAVRSGSVLWGLVLHWLLAVGAPLRIAIMGA
jgi:hypothetical protein